MKKRNKSALENVLDIVYPDHELAIARKIGKLVKRLVKHADTVEEVKSIVGVLRHELDCIENAIFHVQQQTNIVREEGKQDDS